VKLAVTMDLPVISQRERDEPAPGGAPTDDKARQILDGARRVFLTQGFDGASMNDIARAAGVSKGTIYFHFDSKETLFEALIWDERKQQAEQLWQLSDTDSDMATALSGWGHALLSLMVSESMTAQVRTVVAVAAKFPRLGQAFYESGPKFGTERLAAYFARQAQAGKLDAPDPHLAAVHFIQLCQGDVVKQKMFCAIDDVSEARISDTVDAAVKVFMKAYGPSR
jgi:AcrR family transcriptional regulator